MTEKQNSSSTLYLNSPSPHPRIVRCMMHDSNREVGRIQRHHASCVDSASDRGSWVHSSAVCPCTASAEARKTAWMWRDGADANYIRNNHGCWPCISVLGHRLAVSTLMPAHLWSATQDDMAPPMVTNYQLIYCSPELLRTVRSFTTSLQP